MSKLINRKSKFIAEEKQEKQLTLAEQLANQVQRLKATDSGALQNKGPQLSKQNTQNRRTSQLADQIKNQLDKRRTTALNVRKPAKDSESSSIETDSDCSS